MSTTDFEDRPAWLDEGAELAGVAEDIVSGQRYRLWQLASPEKQHRALKRVKRKRPTFVVEYVGSDKLIALLRSWEDSVAWHDRNVISCGWVTGGQSVPASTNGSAREAAEKDTGIAEIRHLPLTREQRAGHSGS